MLVQTDGSEPFASCVEKPVSRRCKSIVRVQSHKLAIGRVAIAFDHATLPIGEGHYTAEAIGERAQLRPVASRPLQDFIHARAVDVFADTPTVERALGEQVPAGVVGEGATVGGVKSPTSVGGPVEIFSQHAAVVGVVEKLRTDRSGLDGNQPILRIVAVALLASSVRFPFAS